MKISERARALDASKAGLRASTPVSLAALAMALDEWQASVEERLASIGLGLVPGVAGETVLASGPAAAPYRLKSIFFDAGPHPRDGYEPDPNEPEHP